MALIVAGVLAAIVLTAAIVAIGRQVANNLADPYGDQLAIETPVPPKRVNELIRTAGASEYWLGRRLGGMGVALIERDGPDWSVEYGTPTCEENLEGRESGGACHWPLFMYPGVGRQLGVLGPEPRAGWRSCWQRLGKAWLVACKPGPESAREETTEAIVLTGDLMIFVSGSYHGDAAFHARRLRRMKDGQPITKAPAPRRLLCKQRWGTPRAFRRAIPASMRPTDC